MKQHIDALYEELYSLRADIMNDGEALFRTWLPGIERRPFRFSALNLQPWTVYVKKKKI